MTRLKLVVALSCSTVTTANFQFLTSVRTQNALSYTGNHENPRWVSDQEHRAKYPKYNDQRQVQYARMSSHTGGSKILGNYYS